MSSELLWQLVKKHNRFIVKRNGVTLSSEPNNLMNKNSFKFSGLVHAKTVGVNPSAKGHKGVELVLKASKKSQQFRPAQAHKVTVLKKGIRRNATAISKTLNKNFYRRDLIAAAQARASQINKAHLGKAQKKEVAAK